MGGPSVSRYAEEKEEVVPDDQKTAFDWCKEGHVTRLAAMVTEDNINEKDEQVSRIRNVEYCTSECHSVSTNNGVEITGFPVEILTQEQSLQLSLTWHICMRCTFVLLMGSSRIT